MKGRLFYMGGCDYTPSYELPDRCQRRGCMVLSKEAAIYDCKGRPPQARRAHLKSDSLKSECLKPQTSNLYHPPLVLRTTFLRGIACHWIFSRHMALCEFSSLAASACGGIIRARTSNHCRAVLNSLQNSVVYML